MHEGCRCPVCNPGLTGIPPGEHHGTRADAMTDRDRDLVALIFGESTIKVRCDGTYVCACPRCIDERHARVVNIRRARPRQPWELAA